MKLTHTHNSWHPHNSHFTDEQTEAQGPEVIGIQPMCAHSVVSDSLRLRGQ